MEQNSHVKQDVNVARMKIKAYEAKLRVCERELQESSQALHSKELELTESENMRDTTTKENLLLTVEHETQVKIFIFSFTDLHCTVTFITHI